MLLENIYSPKDIKVLTMKQLHELAQEIRDGILNRDSHIGGHVGPNLGIVEVPSPCTMCSTALRISSSSTFLTRVIHTRC